MAAADYGTGSSAMQVSGRVKQANRGEVALPLKPTSTFTLKKTITTAGTIEDGDTFLFFTLPEDLGKVYVKDVKLTATGILTGFITGYDIVNIGSYVVTLADGVSTTDDAAAAAEQLSQLAGVNCAGLTVDIQAQANDPAVITLYLTVETGREAIDLGSETITAA